MNSAIASVSHRNGCQVMVRGLGLASLGYGPGARVTVEPVDQEGDAWRFVVANRETATMVCRHPPPPPWIQAGVRVRVSIVESPERAGAPGDGPVAAPPRRSGSTGQAAAPAPLETVARRMRLPAGGRFIGVDWSGGKDAGAKVWSAELDFGGPHPRLASLGRPFPGSGPPEVAAALGPWLAERAFDAAGFDFCFGLARAHLARLRLPTHGPRALGRAIAARFQTEKAFQESVGREARRATDGHARSPFAPTNLRMYRQTYWGLLAMAAVDAPVAPWRTSGPRIIAEVLPRSVASWLGFRGSYKERDPASASARVALLDLVAASTGLRLGAGHRDVVAGDAEGDALDAILAALAAASAASSGFTGAPPDAASSGEGWIYSVSGS